MDKNYKVVHSKYVAMYLVRKGFDFIKVDDNKENPKYKVFLFIDSEELENAIKEYKPKKAILNK